MKPTPSDVHVNRPMTNISIAYIQSQDVFVASKIFPNIPVEKQSDIYFRFEKGEFFRDDMAQRAPGTESEGSSYNVDTAPAYFCREWSVHRDIPDQVRSNADKPLNPDRETTIFLTNRALMRRERLWTGAYFRPGVWDTDVEGVSGAPGAGQTRQWNDDASDPIRFIRDQKRAMRESTGFEPNTLVLGRQTYDALIEHGDFIDRVKYGQTPGQPAKVNMQAVQALLEIERLFVMNAVVNLAGPGQPAQNRFVAGPHAFLCFSTAEPGLMTPTAGYTFSWTGQPGAGEDGVRIRSFRMESKRSDRYEVDLCTDHQKVAADMGAFFENIVAAA